MARRVSDIAVETRAPGPDAVFAIGPDDDTRRRFVEWHKAHGDVYRVPAERGSDYCIVHDPALVQQILVRNSANYSKGMGLDRVRILLGNGIMVSEGDFWARQRRLMQPAFKPRALADFNAMIFDENQRLAVRWQENAAQGDAVDVAGPISELTLIIVLKSIFGADFQALVNGADHPFKLLTEEPERNLKFAARFRRLTRVVDALIEKRQGADREEFDLLGHLLAARTRSGEAMSRRELIDEVMTLIVAGHETTASALAWAWYLIAMHPDICARLQAEADAVDEANLRDTGGNTRGVLAYTDQVLRETLRLYPPGWLLSRRAIESDRLGEHVIEVGTQIFISPYILHRHADYWREPERFDPDRFARGEPGHRFAYLPFAAGPRHCIGEHLAMAEMRVHLATLLRRFTPAYTRAQPPVMESHINLRPRDGVFSHLTPR